VCGVCGWRYGDDCEMAFRLQHETPERRRALWETAVMSIKTDSRPPPPFAAPELEPVP
jgi:hypothetical protein